MPMNDRERQVLKMQNYSSLKDAQRGNVLLPACPSRLILGHLTSGWGVLVLVALRTGTKRFNQLRREIKCGIFLDRVWAAGVGKIYDLVNWLEVNLGEILKKQRE